MGSKRAFAISSQRRGLGRAAAFLVVLAIAVSGCGHVSASESEKAADAEVLNSVLSQELTTVAAYEEALALLRGGTLAVAAQLRGQNQAHLDAITKAIRGIGGKTEAEAAELETPGPKGREEALLLAYEEENAALGEALDATSHLSTSAASTLAASLAASHAQHMVALRQLLGTGLAASIPDAFETGEASAPVPPGKGG
ncbi:MAG TPA: ferritin-like domain-containing protein [Solirubrobacterales bacterium]|nr:ferritin-like domain-containing protein [Solirubrobacterales bacterium]